jgi:hypothetical protein
MMLHKKLLLLFCIIAAAANNAIACRCHSGGYGSFQTANKTHHPLQCCSFVFHYCKLPHFLLEIYCSATRAQIIAFASAFLTRVEQHDSFLRRRCEFRSTQAQVTRMKWRLLSNKIIVLCVWLSFIISLKHCQ